MSAALAIQTPRGRLPETRLQRLPRRPRCAARAALVATRCGSTTANGAYLGLPRAKSTAATLVLKLGSLPPAIDNASDSR